jgi:H+/gluconate symporter-like permease
MVDLGDAQIPLGPLDGMNSWALVNLVLSAIGIVLAIMALVRFLVTRRRREEESSDEYLEDLALSEEEQRKQGRLRVIYFVAIMLSAVAGVATFLLTQNMSYTMVLIDWWSALHGALTIICTVGCICLFRKRKDKDDGDTVVVANVQ